MARFDQDENERQTETVKVSHLVDCPECDNTFDLIFDTGELDMEMVDDDISTEAECPACHHKWTQQYEGWTAHTDAG